MTPSFIQNFVLAESRNDPQADHREGLLLSCVMFALIAGLLLISTEHPDTVFFGGDQWEYQSMAVNWSLGAGLKFGGIFPFQTYKYKDPKTDPNANGDIQHFMKTGQMGGIYNFSRSPGYPLFLGCIYRVMGIHPKYARWTQTILLACVIGFLPFLGSLFWGQFGIAAGVFSAPLLIQEGCLKLADNLLSEPLIIFYLFVLFFVFYWWEQRKSIIRTCLFCLYLGFGLMIKSHLIFLPGLFAVSVILFAGLDLKKSIVLGFILIAGTSIVYLSYSLYTSYQLKKVTFLSSQGVAFFSSQKWGAGEALLDGNNEFAAVTGVWERRWRDIPDSYFHRPDLVGLSPVRKVLRFYQTYPTNLIKILPHKIYQGFGRYPFYLFFVATVILTFYEFRKRDSYNLFIRKVINIISVPVIVILLNYVLMTMIFFAERRLIEVIDFLVLVSSISMILKTVTHTPKRFQDVTSYNQ